MRVIYQIAFFTVHTFLVDEHSNRAKIESGANHMSTVHAFVIATLRIGLHTPLVARRRKLCVCVCVCGVGGGGV